MKELIMPCIHNLALEIEVINHLLAKEYHIIFCASTADKYDWHIMIEKYGQWWCCSFSKSSKEKGLLYVDLGKVEWGFYKNCVVHFFTYGMSACSVSDLDDFLVEVESMEDLVNSSFFGCKYRYSEIELDWNKAEKVTRMSKALTYIYIEITNPMAEKSLKLFLEDQSIDY